MYDAGLTELDLSVELSVDPKTVRNWMRGQIPHPGTRASLMKLLSVDAGVAWPELGGAGGLQARPVDLAGVYPHLRSLKERDWLALFAGARTQIDVLAYSALFLLEIPRLIGVLQEQADAGVLIRIALGAPSTHAPAGRGVNDSQAEDGVGRLRRSLLRLSAVQRSERIEIRLHDQVLYNSIYRSDDHLLVNQYSYGMPAADSPVYHYCQSDDGELFDAYVSSFETLWTASRRES